MTFNRAAQPACEPLRLAAGPVFACSGQGAQRSGMGADMMGIPEVNEVFECASDVFGVDVATLCACGDAAALNDTRNAQAAIATLSIAIGRALQARGVVPSAFAGFSLGQVSALALSGMLTDERALSVASVRARLMGEAADANPGAMTALSEGRGGRGRAARFPVRAEKKCWWRRTELSRVRSSSRDRSAPSNARRRRGRRRAAAFRVFRPRVHFTAPHGRCGRTVLVVFGKRRVL